MKTNCLLFEARYKIQLKVHIANGNATNFSRLVDGSGEKENKRDILMENFRWCISLKRLKCCFH